MMLTNDTESISILLDNCDGLWRQKLTLLVAVSPNPDFTMVPLIKITVANNMSLGTVAAYVKAPNNPPRTASIRMLLDYCALSLQFGHEDRLPGLLVRVWKAWKRL